MRRLLSAAVAAAAGVVLVLSGACASSPTQHFKLSAAADPARVQGAPDDQTRPSVAVGPVIVPALVDRPQMVFNSGTNHPQMSSCFLLSMVGVCGPPQLRRWPTRSRGSLRR